MNKKIKYFFLWTLFLSSIFCFAQQNKIDSLHSVLKALDKASSSEFKLTIKGGSSGIGIDTIRINTLNSLAWMLKFNNPDSSILFCTQALGLSKKLNWEKGIVYSLINLGIYSALKGDYPPALKYFFKALEIAKKIKTKHPQDIVNNKRISATLGNIGLVYHYQGDYPNALNYYFKALKIAEELEDKNEIAATLSNIGGIYNSQADYPKAFDYYFKALKMARDLGDKNGIAQYLNDIGTIYLEQKDYSKGFDFVFKALKMAKELGLKQLQTNILANIGNAYTEKASSAKSQHDIVGSDSLFKEALSYYFKALKMGEGVGDKAGIANNLGNIGSTYISLKRNKAAEVYLQKALKISLEMKALDLIKDHQQMLSNLYQQSHQSAKALEHYKKYIEAKDSLFNEENTKKTVRSEMNFEFEKKQAIEKAEQEKQNAIAQQEKQKQKIILILVSCFLMLVAVFAGFMFNRWRITQKQKSIIEKQKEKIVDSITYAQLIQQSILMEESEIQKLLPDSFIYFQPKDIVSGDFYWCSVINHKIIIATVDCTGHGVPGAFMSMIGNTLLNQIVNEKQIAQPSEILSLLNQEVIESLHQSKDGALSRDGMAISLCSIDYKNNQLEYAGAENPLYILADNEITVVKADRHGIGSGGLMDKKKNPATKEFTNHIIPIKKGMTIYLFSDGYMDQFGGAERKKLGVQKFKELLLDNQHISMQEQKNQLLKPMKIGREALHRLMIF